jgi:hypothetical protein
MKTAVQRRSIVLSVNMTMNCLTLVPSLLQGYIPIDSLRGVYLVGRIIRARRSDLSCLLAPSVRVAADERAV